MGGGTVLLSIVFVGFTLFAFLVFVVRSARAPRPRAPAPLPSAPRLQLICPSCKRAALEVELGMDFPPDGMSDEVALQLLRCRACNFIGVGVYEESRRGSLDRESFHHFGYPISREDHERLRNLIATCSTPHDPSCTCQAHTFLGKHSDSNDWDGLRQNGYELGQWFRIDLGPA